MANYSAAVNSYVHDRNDSNEDVSIHEQLTAPIPIPTFGGQLGQVNDIILPSKRAFNEKKMPYK